MTKTVGAALLLFLLVLLVTVTPVLAQEPDPTETPIPTPSPTPDFQQGVSLSTGNTLLIQRTVTFGDIAITVAVLILAAVHLVGLFVSVPRMWVKQ